MKTIKTTNPPPQLIRTETVMERVQIDLTEMYGPKSPLLSQSRHKNRFVLSVMDCFSKYCWLTPLTNKSADTVVHVLHDIFVSEFEKRGIIAQYVTTRYTRFFASCHEYRKVRL